MHRFRQNFVLSSGASTAQEDILRCLYSISDNNSFLLFNRDPVDCMIEYLHTYFRPDYAESGASLAISGGLAGARLTHNHERQFHYVLQSLTLWREISHDVSTACHSGRLLLQEDDLLHCRNANHTLLLPEQMPC